MKILDWLQKNFPGEISHFSDRIEFEHQSGHHSTLWNAAESGQIDVPPHLAKLYRECDGADLLSSAFKLATLHESKGRGGVLIVPTLSELIRDELPLDRITQENGTPFMIEPGVSVYYLGHRSGLIYRVDSESSAVVDRFQTIENVLDDWLKVLQAP